MDNSAPEGSDLVGVADIPLYTLFERTENHEGTIDPVRKWYTLYNKTLPQAYLGQV